MTDLAAAVALVATDPDPPRRPYRRRAITPTVKLNMLPEEAIALWREIDTDRSTVLIVSRRALIHLLMDHSTMVAALVAGRWGIKP